MTPQVELLGQARVLASDGWRPLPKDKRGALLAVLAYHSDWMSREKLAFLFWPDMPNEQARLNLRQLLARVRAMPIAGSLESNNQQLRWQVSSDTSTFLNALEHARWEKAITLYQGSFLSDFDLEDATEFSTWLELERRNLESRYRQAVSRWSEQLEQDAEYQKAVALWQRLLELDPLDENSLQHYLRLAQATHQASVAKEALGAYEEFKEQLREEIGLEPQTATQVLAQVLRDNAPVLATPRAARRTLPTPRAPYIGRDPEITDLLNLLSQPERRLITLLGPGGIGKTALALQVASEAMNQFRDGAAFVPLAPLQDAALTPTAIASGLSLGLHGSVDPETQVLAYLQNKHLLLVLDNLEHLPDSAPFIARIIESCPEVKILATSRSRLKLSSEWLFPVEGLNFPKGSLIEPLESYDAVRLFALRARQVQPDFSLGEGNRDAVLEVCQRVAGAPLGLELAAGLTRLLSCQEIAAALGSSLDVLASDLHDLPERHQSLRAVFEHSWALLSPEEQMVLRKLSVFQGGFTREAAEAVAGASSRALLALLDKSLLKRNADERFDLHELVRQFAAEKLSESLEEEQNTRDHHLTHFLKLAQDVEPELRGSHQVALLRRLEQEHDNLRGALAWALQAEQIERALDLTANLGRFWELHGHLSEGMRWIERTLDQSKSLPKIPALMATQAKALASAGVLARYKGDFSTSYDLLGASLKLSQEVGDTRGVAWGHHHLGLVAQYRGDYCEAAIQHRTSLTLAREVGDRVGIYVALFNLAETARAQGDTEEAKRLHQESLILKREQGDLWSIAWSLYRLGNLARLQAKYSEAVLLHSESLSLRWQLQDRLGICRCLVELAVLAALEKQPERSVRLLGAAEAGMETIGASLPADIQGDLKQIVLALQEQLGTEAYCRLAQSGRQMNLEQSCRLGLQSQRKSVELHTGLFGTE